MKIPGILILSLAAFKAIVCASLASNSSSESSTRNNEEHEYLVDYLMGVIEILRENMKKGVPAMNIPPLEPLEVKNVNIKLKENFLDADVDIKKMTVNGLSGFQINEISPDLGNLFIRTNITFPQLEASGWYKVRGRLMVIFPLSGNGDFQIKVSKGSLLIAAQFEVIDDVLQLKDLDLNADWEKLEVYLENFLGDEKFSQTLHKMLPAVSKGLFKRFRPTLSKILKKELKGRINTLLQKPEFKHLIQPFLTEKEDSQY